MATNKNKAESAKTPAALEEKIAKIVELERAADRDEISKRFGVAQQIQAVADGDGRRYGDGAIVKVAEALGWSEEAARQYERVANAWTKKDIREMSKRVGKYGLPICWSHLVAIASVETKRRRASLINKVLNQGLSVRDLKQEIAEDNEPRCKKPATLRATARSLSTKADELIKYSGNAKKVLNKKFTGKNASVLSEAVIDDLEAARDKQVEAKGALGEQIKAIDECVKRAKAALKTKATE